MSEVKDEILDHNYDGIEEYDNPLPKWWINFFYFTIVFSVVYLTYYTFTDMGPSMLDEYALELEVAEEAEWDMADDDDDSDGGTATEGGAWKQDDDLAALMAEGNNENGKKVYMTNCTACHLDDGGGLVGPNLCDDFWINGGSDKDIMTIIINGKPEKGMMSWKPILAKQDIIDVASYIKTFHGTTPAVPKAAQGDKYVPSDATPSSETPVGETPVSETPVSETSTEDVKTAE